MKTREESCCHGSIFDPFQPYLSAMLSSARPRARVTQDKHSPAVDMAA